VGKIGEGGYVVNKISEEELKKAPKWKWFGTICQFVDRWKRGWAFGQNHPCGKNIVNFDLPIVNRLCRKLKRRTRRGSPTSFIPGIN